jgi:hypothetical protein
MLNLFRAELIRGRQLDRGNAQSGSLGADFGRFSIDFWSALAQHHASVSGWRADLDLLNDWRNAIAHQDFTSPRLGGIINLHLAQVRRWRASCHRLARAIDEVLHRHLLDLTKAPPW